VAEASESSAESTSPSWEQGSLLPESVTLLPLQWVHPDTPATKTAKGAVTAARRRGEVTEPFPVPGPGKQGDRMMVISQSCDIVKPASDLPQVEVARVFTTDKPRTIAQAQDFGSARYFRVNNPAEPVAAILDYGQRALLDKGFLSAVAPDNTLLDALDDEQRKTLAAWLGRRYSRPAVPDEDYPVITGPVREAWRQLVEEEPESAQRFNREYAEWRYRREDDGSLTIYILALRDQPDEMTALEVTDFLTQALQGVYPGPVNVATDKRSYFTFTKADELSTEQINMEWVSRDEDAEDAALPE
jgi:hypothetical protein